MEKSRCTCQFHAGSNYVQFFPHVFIVSNTKLWAGVYLNGLAPDPILRGATTALELRLSCA